MDLAGKRVLILGLAREGASLARYCVQQGAEVTVTDRAPADRLGVHLEKIGGLPVQLELGRDAPELVDGADLFFVSPGVPENNPVYRLAVERGMLIQSMTTLFFALCPGRIIGITGSSGKTTTTGLIGHILRTAGRDVVVGGNIGDPMLDLLPQISSETLVVLELSSFQLGILGASPHIAVVTNISPNHLDRHGTMEAYIEAKRQIAAHQGRGDWAVLNSGDPVTSAFAETTPATCRWFGYGGVVDGATVHKGSIGLVREGRFVPVMPEANIPLLGRHNVENVLAALAAAAIVGIETPAMAEAIRTFRPAPHRLELVADRDGVRYVDDSIATSPSRMAVALQAMDRPVLLIAGGRDKHLPWEEVAQLIVQKAHHLFLIGEAAALIDGAVRQQLGRRPGLLAAQAIHHCNSLEEAVDEARRLARPGDTVLLSPGCTSYDMFSDFEQRGQVFARAVEELHAA